MKEKREQEQKITEEKSRAERKEYALASLRADAVRNKGRDETVDE